MNEVPKYYEILKLNKDATLYDIQTAKDKLKFGIGGERVPFSEWGKIDEAYSVLSNPDKRKEYDNLLDNISNNNQEILETKDEEITPTVELDSSIPNNSHKKLKLYDNFKSKELIGIETYELTSFKEYELNLKNDINKLLSQPHESNKLEELRIKYEFQIALLRQHLNIISSRNLKSGFEALKNKLEILSIKRQLKLSEAELQKTAMMIKKYNLEKSKFSSNDGIEQIIKL